MSDQLYTDREQTEKYRAYRPNYPKQIYEHIIDYYFDGKTKNEKIPIAIDVACGNGQTTADLNFVSVSLVLIDVSENQIANAIQKENIQYRCIKVLHWLDFDQFFNEIKRVLKPQTGVFALNNKTLSPYWDKKVFIIGDCYQSILSLFSYQSTLQQYNIERPMETTIAGLLGFIQTTSGCQKFRNEKGEQIYQDTLNIFREKLIQSYTHEDETTDFDAIKVSYSSPIRLYLMRKIEGK